MKKVRRNDGIGIFSDVQKFVLSVALVFIAMLAAPYSFAQHVAPDTLLKAVTADVIAIIRQDEEIQAGTPARVADLVEARILPLFDFTRMTQAAVARNWRFATPAQQKALTTEFTLLLVRTYAASLSSYRDRIIEFKPLTHVHCRFCCGRGCLLS